METTPKDKGDNLKCDVGCITLSVIYFISSKRSNYFFFILPYLYNFSLIMTNNKNFVVN